MPRVTQAQPPWVCTAGGGPAARHRQGQPSAAVEGVLRHEDWGADLWQRRLRAQEIRGPHPQAAPEAGGHGAWAQGEQGLPTSQSQAPLPSPERAAHCL